MRLIDRRPVAEALVAAGWSEAGAGISLDRAWPDRHGGVVALYLDSAGERLEGSWCVRSLPGGGPTGACAKALRRGRARRLPGLEALAWRFPADPRLDRLGELLDGRRMARELAPWLPDGVEDLAPRVRRYKPSRRSVVELRPRAGGEASWFCKMLRPAEVDAVAGIYRAVGRGPASVAHPAGRLEELDSLVWRGTPGLPLTDLLRTPRAPAGSRAIGRAIAALHATHAVLARRHLPGDELAALERWTGLAARCFPRSGPLVERAFEQLCRVAPPGPTSRLCTSHRDFHDRQVLVAGERATLLDLDTAAMAEPELDVGNFIAHLEFHQLLHAGLETEAAAAAFLEGYVEARGSLLAAATLSWYRSAALLRLACVHAFRVPTPERSLEIGYRVLSRLHAAAKTRYREEAGR